MVKFALALASKSNIKILYQLVIYLVSIIVMHKLLYQNQSQRNLKMISATIVILINLLICIQSDVLFEKYGDLPNNQTHIKFIAELPANQQRYLTISFSIESTRNFTYTVVTASFGEQQTISYQNISKALQDPSTYSGSADLQSLVEGKIQHIQLQKTDPNTKNLYISIHNFDPKTLKRDIAFKILIESNKFPREKVCDNDLAFAYEKSQSCECVKGYFGQYCQNKLIEIIESKVISLEIQQDSIVYYEIPKMNQQIIFSIQVRGQQVELYLLKSKAGKPATYFTYFYGNAGKISLPKQNSKIKAGVQINTWLQEPLYLTIAKYTPQKTKILMEFRTVNILSKFIILLVILFVISGFFSLLLLLALKIRNYSQIRRARIFRRHFRARNIILIQQDIGISPELKNKHFPSFKIADVFHANEQFFQNNLQCPICLCQYQQKDEASLLYCGHMFHDDCINQWFQTNKNCPYCRQLFNTAKLKKYKSQIQQITGGEQVTGIRHVQSLLCILPTKKESTL